jgi:superfamily II DNA or RNA helicase
MRPLREYQQRSIEELRRALQAGDRPVLSAPTGSGKCLGIGTPVLKFNGEISAVENIKVGDLLMGPDGTSREVLSTCKSSGELYKIIPVKGQPWVCNDVHVLTLVNTQSGEIIDIPLSEYLGRSKWFRHMHKQFQPEEGVDFPGAQDPEIDPYFFGAWLGDGTKSMKVVQITKNDIEIRDICQKVADEHGLNLVKSNADDRAAAYSIAGSCGGNKKNEVLEKLRVLFAGQKIHHSVLTSTRQYRINVLAGIIDTDGCAQSGCVEVTQKNKNIADGIAFIARSLGFKVVISDKYVKENIYYRLSISGNFGPIPTRIKRKTIGERRQIKKATRTGFAVESMGHGEYAGFELSGDGRFLLGDFTVTHNTKIAATIFALARMRNRRVCFVVPFLSLINQTWRAFVAEGIDEREIGIIQGKHDLTDWSREIQICSVETLNRRPKLPSADIVIFDECHRRSKLYERWMADNPEAKFIGLTATPFTKGMDKLWSRLIVVSTISELIDQGYLSKFKYYAPSIPDLSGIKTVAGDYHEGQLGDRMSQKELVADIVTTWLKRAEWRPTFCFAVNRKHALEVQFQFENAGVPCGYIDAYTPVDEREKMIENLQNGILKVIASVGCLTTGVDAPFVSCLIMARPTKSESLYIQIVGRVLRTHPEKDYAIVLDHSSTALNLGRPDEIHYDQFNSGKKEKSEIDDDDEDEKEKKEKKGRLCPRCACVAAPKDKSCSECGYEFPIPQSDVSIVDGELGELGKKGSVGAVSMNDKQVFYSGLLWIAKQRGYSDGWSAHTYKKRFGVWPRGLDSIAEYPTEATRKFVRSKQIAYAKARERSMAD